jgi:hypothetical protein
LNQDKAFIMKYHSPLAIAITLAGLMFGQLAFGADQASDFDGTWELTYFERDGKEVKLQARLGVCLHRGHFQLLPND